MGRSARYEHVEFYLRPHAAQGDAVLEIGCGSAPYRDLFRPGRYVGTDRINTHYQQPGDVDVYCGAEALPFRDEAFDLVFCQAAIDYINDIHTALSEVHRVLKPGGRMLIVTYRRATLKRIHETSASQHEAVMRQHHVFTTSELSGWLRHSGFTVRTLPMRWSERARLRRFVLSLPPVAWYRRRRSVWRIVAADKPVFRAVA